MNPLFDVLYFGWILAWDEDMEIFVTWNGSATYNFWAATETGYDNFDVATVNPNPNGHPVSLDEAANIANQLLTDKIKGEE